MGIFRDATVVVCFADLVSSCCFQSTKVKVIPVTSLLGLNVHFLPFPIHKMIQIYLCALVSPVLVTLHRDVWIWLQM